MRAQEVILELPHPSISRKSIFRKSIFRKSISRAPSGGNTLGHDERSH
jgi:hypothetical protein